MIHAKLRRELRTVARCGRDGSPSQGMAGMLALQKAPASAQKRCLTMITAEHFVPVSDDNLRAWMAEFARLNNIDGKLDSIAHRNTYVRLATEAETKTGHDIVWLFFNSPQLYAEHLIDREGHEHPGCR